LRIVLIALVLLCAVPLSALAERTPQVGAELPTCLELYSKCQRICAELADEDRQIRCGGGCDTRVLFANLTGVYRAPDKDIRCSK
jgi:hypothetical protein